MSKVVNIALRGLQFLWTLLIMALIGNAIAERHQGVGSSSMTNYVMFTAVFSMLTLFYTFPTSFNDGLMGHAIIPTVLDGLNAVFTFCAAIALAAVLGAHNCANQDYTNNNSALAFAGNQEKVCRESQASDAFLWFLWATYMGSLVFSVMGLRSGGSAMRGGAGGIRRGPPAMSQV